MKNLIKTQWYRISTTVLMVVLILSAFLVYGSNLETQAMIGKANETFTEPFQNGSTTEYRTFTKDEYIQYLLQTNKNLYDTGIKLRDNLIACQNG